MKRTNLFYLRRNGILLISFLCSFLIMGSVNGQVIIKGNVIDKDNEPLTGATIAVKGTSTGTITDAKGDFELTVPDANSTLLVSYIGYKNKELSVAGQTFVQIMMEAEIIGINEIVIVGYGTQKRSNITSAISNVSGEELRRSPINNISNMLRGTVPGVISLQQSGQPGSDGASIMVRGGTPIYVVDGVPRDINELDPNEIESISFLKDAGSAAVYGLNASSVVIVTTRRGVEAPSKITFTGGYGVSDNAVMLEMLDGPEYAYWYNKAREMDGDSPVFSSSHVAMMTNGDPTDGWGNTEWYKETFGLGTTMNLNVNVTGGTDRIKYFVSLGEYSQKGNVKNFNYNRINLRSNIDAKIARNLDVTFDISGRIEDRNRPGYSADPNDWNNVPQQAMRALPFVPMTIDGEPVSTRTASSYVNPLAASELTGYGKVKTNILQTNFALNYKVPFIKGLSAKFMSGYDISFQTTKYFSFPYYTYVANVPTTTTDNISYTYTYDARGTGSSLSEGLSHYAHLTTNTSLKYENRFGKHNISALALFETRTYIGNSFSATGKGFAFPELDELMWESIDVDKPVNGSSYVQKVAGFVGRISYDYDKKYLAEVSGRYDGSFLFIGMKNRWTPLPSASIGWRVSEEDWLSNRFNWLDELKLRASVGLTGTTGILKAYSYLNSLSTLDKPAVVLGGVAREGLITSKPANVNLTWEKLLQYNFGFDVVMWKGLLGVNVDAFYNYGYDILGYAPDIYPASYGGYKPAYVNNDRIDRRGIDIGLSHKNKIGDFSYNIQVTTTYTKRRWLRYGLDAVNTPDYLKLTGKDAGAQLGFIAEGLFQSQEEIDNSPLIVGKDVRVGDIKYKDRNGDGIISYDQDRGYIGKSAYPKFEAGLSFNCNWKGFDASFLIQGALGRDVALTGVYSSGVMDNTSMTKPFYHGGNSPQYLVENSWTETNTDAEFPRLAIVSASSNNAFSSTFWYRNGDYVRLKNFQIGYTFPQKWVDLANLATLRVYAEGQNLLTLSNLTKYGIDPESPGVSNGFYPQQRVLSMGLKLVF